ncbi:hypothetical protein I302_105465 [Kwoniella bestiolae CBS 10118]|uniref:Uncharacterized protein n=1 Tax=Kwoniella bestiolae CBS 10118 TaxID=1296100 RepID=A0A1B9FT71_9TREE|nr:hypothetical protein I302_08747 [Kwoniella bestiolae CBS 10118]OCF21966.1 hypothetical protein I302_08747 [Kwoniella bestiolae CBS 10118]
MSSRIGSPQITKHGLFSDGDRNVIIVRQNETGDTTPFTRQRLGNYLRSDINQYPGSRIIHETIFRGSNPFIDSSTGLEVRDVTRVYHMTNQGGYHLPTCQDADCMGFSDYLTAEREGESRSNACVTRDDVGWYELPANPLVGDHTGRPLFYLMTKVERHERGKSSRSGTEREATANTIEHNLIMVRPDLQAQNEEVPYYRKKILKRYHLPTCIDSLCPGSSDQTNASSKGKDGTTKCRPDLNYPFDHGIHTPSFVNGGREEDRKYEESCFSQLIENLEGMTVKDEAGNMVIPEYPLSSTSRPQSRLIRLDDRTHSSSFGQRMEHKGYSISTSRDVAPQRYSAHFEDEHTPSSPEALTSARREVCPEYEGTKIARHGTVAPKPRARAMSRPAPRSQLRTPTRGLSPDQDALFSTSPLRPGRANVEVSDQDFSYVTSGELQNTSTRKGKGALPEPMIRRSGESLPSSPSSFQESMGTSVAPHESEVTPNTYYSPEMPFGWDRNTGGAIQLGSDATALPKVKGLQSSSKTRRGNRGTNFF